MNLHDFFNEGREIKEGVMKDIHIELSDIVANEDFDALYKLFSASTPAGRFVQDMYDDIVIDTGLHPDDDFEQIEQIVFDRLADEFGEEGMSENSLNEFAADDGDSGGEDDALRNYARMWWAGDEATQMQIERALAKMGWEIGEDEGGYDNGGVFVVRAGDINGNSYTSWSAEDLTEGLTEVDRRGFLKGLGAAAVAGAAGGATAADVRSLSKEEHEIIYDALTIYYLATRVASPSTPDINWYQDNYKQSIDRFIKSYGPNGKNLINDKFRQISLEYSTHKGEVAALKNVKDTFKPGQNYALYILKRFNSLIDHFNESVAQGVAEQELDEACWKGYHKEGMKTMFGKRYPNCVKNKNESLETYIRNGECPGCGGTMVAEGQLNEKQDACYHKVKSRYKVWPSAYASGALVQCRKKGAANWGDSNESITQEEYDQLDENLKKWFSDKWVRFGPDGKIRGDCARGDSSEGKPKCLPQSKAHSLGKKGRASAASRKRREDPDPERSGKAINVSTDKKTNEGMTEGQRVARKPGQPAGSKKHSDLYTDENPKGTITGLKFATAEDAKASVSKIRNSGRSHAHKIQAAVAMEQRARAAGKTEAAAVYRRYINANKKTESVNQGVAEGPTDDPRFQKMMGNIQKSTPKYVPVTGYVAVSFASEQGSKKIKGVSRNGKPIPTNIDDPDQFLSGKIEFTPDQVEQQLMSIGKKYGWDSIDSGQSQGFTEMFFDTAKEYTSNNYPYLATNIVKTVKEINKFFADINKSLQTTGLPGYVSDVWQGMGPPENTNQIEDLDQIISIAKKTAPKADPGPEIGKVILANYKRFGGEDGYSRSELDQAAKIAKIYITQGERAGFQAQHNSDVSDMIDELLSDAGSDVRTIYTDDPLNPMQIEDQGVAEGSEEINWIKPNFDYEWDEIEFQAKQPQVPADVRNYMSKHFPNKQAWMKSVQHGRPVVVSPNHGQKIRNYTDNKRDLLNALSPESHDPQGPAKAKRVNALFDKGGPIEMPIILQTKKGLWLIGGKTRLGTANLLKGIPAKVWMIGGEQGVAEARKKKKSSRSLGRYFFPGYGYYGSGDSGEGGGDGGGESKNRGMAEETVAYTDPKAAGAPTKADWAKARTDFDTKYPTQQAYNQRQVELWGQKNPGIPAPTDLTGDTEANRQSQLQTLQQQRQQQVKECAMTEEGAMCPVHGLNECGNAMVYEAVSGIELAEILLKGFDEKYPDLSKQIDRKDLENTVMDAVELAGDIDTMSDVDMMIDDIALEFEFEQEPELASEPMQEPIKENKLYYNVIGTPANQLRSNFGLRKDANGWYLNEDVSIKRLMTAFRAFGEPSRL